MFENDVESTMRRSAAELIVGAPPGPQYFEGRRRARRLRVAGAIIAVGVVAVAGASSAWSVLGSEDQRPVPATPSTAKYAGVELICRDDRRQQRDLVGGFGDGPRFDSVQDGVDYFAGPDKRSVSGDSPDGTVVVALVRPDGSAHTQITFGRDAEGWVAMTMASCANFGLPSQFGGGHSPSP